MSPRPARRLLRLSLPAALALAWVALGAVEAQAQAQAHAPDPMEEGLAVQDRLLLERAALAQLKDQRAGVLELIDLLHARGRASAQRSKALERELRALQRQKALVSRQAALANALVAAQVEELGPRLRAMYRLQRRGKLEVLLSAGDFASLVWRQRALTALVERDVQLLGQTRAAQAFQARTEAMLARVEDSLSQRAELMARERALAQSQAQVLSALLRQIGADAQLAARVVRELELTDRRLAQMVEVVETEVADNGFGRLRGRMPWPTRGLIEVTFGQVLNPRFNTVTFQKGLDLRAPMGEPVRAVASGKVVHAGWMKGYGNLLIVDHGGGYHTVMAHLAGFLRTAGDEVLTGDELARVGDSGSNKGAYLYFELRKNGIAVDPKSWLAAPEE